MLLVTQQRNTKKKQNGNIDADIEPSAEPCGGRRFDGEPSCKPDEQCSFQFRVISLKGNAAREKEGHAPADHDGPV
jgi:hypothetical protein